MINYLVKNEPNGALTKKLLSTNEENYRDMAYNYYCSKIYNEAQLMAQIGLQRMHKDLFLEQRNYFCVIYYYSHIMPPLFISN